MEVLVVESEPGAAAIAIAQLKAGGHQVKRCHEPGARAFPCAGLDPGHCPLEDDAIDVALTVRARTRPRPSPLEDGVICALRRRAPVVVAGRTTLNPFAPYPVTIAGVDVVEACERAATGPQLEHEGVGTRVLEETLARAGLPTEAGRVLVHRSGSGLRITLSFPAETSKKVREIASVRVAGAVRAFDPHAPRIDISCEDL